MHAVSFEKVSKSWGTTFALQPTDLLLPAHQFTVLLGPSGCGKTTTLRLIAGLEQPSAGRIRIFDRDMTEAAASERGVSMVFQHYALFPHLSVAENIVFGLRVRKVPGPDIKQKLAQVLDLLSLDKLIDRKPSQLSGGQQQRVALARALVADCKLCLMDEPLSNLDAQLRQEMRLELRALQQKLGLSVVYVTHDQTEAMSMADHVVLLHGGRVEQVATPFDMYQQPATTFAAKFIGHTPMNLIPVDLLKHSVDLVEPINLPAQAQCFGIRPEAIEIHPSDVSPMQRHLTGDVQKVEFTGADALITLAVGSAKFVVRVPGTKSAAIGGRVAIAWSRDSEHWFNVDGRRIPVK